MIVTDETRRVRYDVGPEIFLGGRETGYSVTLRRTDEVFQAIANALIIINNGNKKSCHDMLQVVAGILSAAHRNGRYPNVMSSDAKELGARAKTPDKHDP